MVIYTCDICKKIYDNKTKYIQHINRKFSCSFPSIEVSNSSQQIQNNSNNNNSNNTQESQNNT
jgi:hypothetical protein